MLRRFFNHKALIIAELLVLMLAVPLMMRYVLPPRIIVGVIWLMAIYGVVALKLANPGVAPFHWKFSALNWTNIRPMLWRFVLCAAPLTALVAVVMPEQLFSLPRERPQLWMFVMVFYPLLSVIPQQIIFRGYFRALQKPVHHPGDDDRGKCAVLQFWPFAVSKLGGPAADTDRRSDLCPYLSPPSLARAGLVRTCALRLFHVHCGLG